MRPPVSVRVFNRPNRPACRLLWYARTRIEGTAVDAAYIAVLESRRAAFIAANPPAPNAQTWLRVPPPLEMFIEPDDADRYGTPPE